MIQRMAFLSEMPVGKSCPAPKLSTALDTRTLLLLLRHSGNYVAEKIAERKLTLRRLLGFAFCGNADDCRRRFLNDVGVRCSHAVNYDRRLRLLCLLILRQVDIFAA